MAARTTADEILEKVTLSTLVGEVVTLTRAGGEWKGLCPFHDEKTPSFYVNDKKGFFHCFGCSAHGDAIEWVIRQEGLSRSQATAKLAKLAGVAVKKGGAKLNRSETVTVRLDPKLNYLCELASREQRRTKSSFIEWAIAEAMGSVQTSDGSGDSFSDSPTLKQMASKLWHVDEADRVVALALTAPTLLTHDEQIIWRWVRENGLLWRGRYDGRGDWTWEVREDSLIRERLREHWETFKAVAAGDESIATLPAWKKRRDDDLNDDVPF